MAQKVADGTGLTPTDPLNRFLGVLHHQGVRVHERALAVLSHRVVHRPTCTATWFACSMQTIALRW